MNNLNSTSKTSIDRGYKKNVKNNSITSDRTDGINDVLNISGNSDSDVDPGQLAPNSNAATCMFCDVWCFQTMKDDNFGYNA